MEVLGVPFDRGVVREKTNGAKRSLRSISLAISAKRMRIYMGNCVDSYAPLLISCSWTITCTTY